jgi:methylthioribose-1-phosphate isomerase
MSGVEAVRWSDAGDAVDILDQTRLPGEEVRLQLRSAAEAAAAIREMRVRGAPAIGITAALALALDASHGADLARPQFLARLAERRELLRSARPTAVNLAWALERLGAVAGAAGDASTAAIACALRDEATAILEEDRAMCRRIGEHGLALLPAPSATVLTHCNAGALATGGIGTALAPVYVAHELGRSVRVFADETRPLLQGSRLTAWELARAGVAVTVVADVVAAVLLRERRVDLVMVGADRIAANGDVANKIGTYGLAVLARHHGVPFYVAAPTSTIDAATPTGAGIPIEERHPDEVRRGFGQPTAPVDATVYAPAFDVTPASLITSIITDQGILRPPYDTAISALLAKAEAATPSASPSPSASPQT